MLLKKSLLVFCALSLSACGAFSEMMSFGRSSAPASMAYPLSAGASGPAYSRAEGMPSPSPTGAPLEEPQSTHNESYTRIHENAFLNALNHPFSTFSIDVDTAAYSNLRRLLKQGQLPPADAVRIEEMLNYFRYDYPNPQGNEPFALHSELSECPWKPGHKLLKVGLKAREIDMAEAPSSNLVFLIDVSGSMYPANRLPLLKQSLKLLVDQMRPQDRVAIVVYAGSAGQVLESTPGSQKEKILAALDQLEAGGSTAGGAGIQLAYQVARQQFLPGGNNRVILATDGDFNVGVSSEAELERLIEQKRKEGVFLTVLGYGMGNYKDSKLETLANKGNGNYAYIDDLQEARKVLVEEMGGTLFTVAKDVKLQLEFNPAKVSAYRLIGYENRLLAREDFADDSKDAGELGAGHTVTALYELVPASAETSQAEALTYTQTEIRAEAFASEDLLTLALRYKHPQQDQSQLLSQTLVDQARPWDQASTDMRFAASVAGFGMLLRGSEHKGNTSYNQVLSWGEEGLGNDPGGYRAAYLQLVRQAMQLSR